MFELYFITSNNEKLAHARYLVRDYTIKIQKQKNYGIGYEEPRIKDRNRLLEQSILNASERFQKNVSNPDSKFFFIEDTSVIIEALSGPEEEIPGVDIKYWMRDNSFDVVDTLLKVKGNNRKVIVRSDIVLWLPTDYREKYGKKYYLHFYDQVEGSIVGSESVTKTQPYYPWLNHQTFNKWFVPKGYSEPISKLEINHANQSDFRRKVFNKMVDFFQNEGLVQKKVPLKTAGIQLGFNNPVVFVICGPTCAGKTTIAKYLQEHFSYYHIEASDFMYLNFYERHGVGSNVSIGDFALEALNSNKRIVVDRILDHIEKIKSIPIVITGFRAPEEINEFKTGYNGNWNVEEVWVEADFQKRFERSINRDRHDKILNEVGFKARDKLQIEMGLRGVRESLDETQIIGNNDTFNDYYDEYEQRYHTPLSHSIKINRDELVNSFIKKRSLEGAILKSLISTDQKSFYTTTEIAHLINSFPEYKNKPKSKNNVSRYFNQNYHPYYEIRLNDEKKLSYRLTNTGVSIATWINSLVVDSI